MQSRRLLRTFRRTALSRDPMWAARSSVWIAMQNRRYRLQMSSLCFLLSAHPSTSSRKTLVNGLSNAPGLNVIQRKNQGSAGSDGAVRNRPRRNPDTGTVCTAGRFASRLTCCQRKGQHTDPCDTDKNLLIAFIGLAVVAGIAAIYRKVS